jgi:hypothetical protein
MNGERSGTHISCDKKHEQIECELKMSTSEEDDCVKRLLFELADASQIVTTASSTGDRITGKGTLSAWTKEALIPSSHTGHNRPIWTAQT